MQRSLHGRSSAPTDTWPARALTQPCRPRRIPFTRPWAPPTGCTGRPHTSVARLEMESQLPSRADNAARPRDRARGRNRDTEIERQGGEGETGGGGVTCQQQSPSPADANVGTARVSLRFSPRRDRQVQWAGLGDGAGGCPPSPLQRTQAPAPADCTAAPGRTHAVREGSPLHFILITLETLSSK